MVPANRQPLDFSRTQRLVLLIDLDPILTLQNPSPYFSAVISAANRLLGFPPLSAALSAFKLFFSSLSPLRSEAVLPRHFSSHYPSFYLHSETLASLSTTLNCITSLADLHNSTCCPRASYAATSLNQLVRCAWESEQDTLVGQGESSDRGFVKIPSNLVVLLSPIGQSVNSLIDYLELREFNDVFCAVREAFAVKDIHLCWVDVKIDEIEIVEKRNGCREILVAMRDGITKMGWGFCSSDLIVLCSAFLPLGLIYPKIGVSFDFDHFGGNGRRKYSGELNLEIVGAKGMPVECKFFDLEFVSLKRLSCTVEIDDIFNGSESRDSLSFYTEDALWTRFGKGRMKLLVKSVNSYIHENIGGSSDILLVRECFKESQKHKKDSGEVFSDRILEMLHEEMGGFPCRNQLPSWQMFLSFLHMNGYWALISLSSSNGNTLMGSIKPFTTHLAVLHIFDAGHVPLGGKTGFVGTVRDTCIEDMNDSNPWSGSQTEASTSGNCKKYEDGKRKRIQSHVYQEMTWSSFCKAAIEGSNFDLFELYYARYCEKFKKLKFLKCWLKQFSKVEQCLLKTLPEIKSIEETSGCNVLPSESSPAQEEVMPVSKVESLDAFSNILSEKIRYGLESGMDLQKLAERAVQSSISWLHKKSCDNESNTEGEQYTGTSDDPSRDDVGEKLIKLLLRSPKEMKKIHQDQSDSSSSETIVREYELQILLRMEILRSDVAAMMGESRKQKLLKQICSQLEIIQFLVAGGIHGHVSLYDYVECTIKARYSDKIEDVVKNIYTEMDLLPFGEEDEAPCLLFNSEDSNQSWRDKYDRNEKGEASSLNHSVSTEGESSQPLTNAHNSLQVSEVDDYTRSLNEARQKREKALRTAPFLNKVLDLQRVWAPKHSKATKCKYDARPKKSKRRDRLTPSYSVVCETPMTGNKRTCSRARRHDVGNDSCSTVSKALFQDLNYDDSI